MESDETTFSCGQTAETSDKVAHAGIKSCPTHKLRMKHLKYLNYLLRHRWFVMIECFKMGIYWQGILHDWSKFLPSEWFAYTNYFYGKNSNINRGRNNTGYYKPTDTGDKAFDFAWLLHQKRNRHHWQWWVLPGDDGTIKVLNIPIRYRKEMLCDWMGAGKAQRSRGSAKEWYESNKWKMKLDPSTRKWIEGELNLLF